MSFHICRNNTYDTCSKYLLHRKESGESTLHYLVDRLDFLRGFQVADQTTEAWIQHQQVVSATPSKHRRRFHSTSNLKLPCQSSLAMMTERNPSSQLRLRLQLI